MKKNIKRLAVIIMLISIYIVINSILGLDKASAISQTISTDINGIDSSMYPEIKEMIQALQSEHPNWKFKVLYTDIEWNDAIANEYVGHNGTYSRNLVPTNNSRYAGDWICKVCGLENTYDSGKWYCASEAAIGYMMDVRNSVNNSDIFQFMELSYSDCNIDSVRQMVYGTFLDNETCINTIMEAGMTYNVNVYYLVARLLQEQGSEGSTLSKGQGYNGQYVGYYNVFNIGASGNKKENVILNGLKKAEEKGWNTIEASIMGGTQIIAKNYIAKGQNTLYLQKFDVDNSDGNLYWHQYMQNVLAAQSEGTTLRKKLTNINGNVDREYTFVIPLFKNMPLTAVPRPSTISTGNYTNVELVRVNVNSALKLRSEPRSDAKKLCSISKGDVITRLEKATQKVDGTYWDYVMTSNGTKGYAARETYDYETTYKLYLVPITSSDDTSGESGSTTVIKNEIIKIDTDTNFITTIPDAKVQDLANLLGTDAVVKNSKGEVLSSDAKLSTGCVINDTYTVSVLGDVNGDGEVKSTDYMAIKNAIMGIKELSEIEKKAADVNNDGNIKSTDYMKIKNYIMSNAKIEL